MSGLTIVAALAFIAAAAAASISSSHTSDCSYLGLLDHLNLTSENNVLSLMRPVKNCTTPTVVLVDMILLGILELDEKSQTVTSHTWIQMAWTNEFISWNSSDFCGIDMLSVPKSMLWIPDITITEDISDTGSMYSSPLLSLFPTGWVFGRARHRLTSTCQLDLFLFPFDVQYCNISFTSTHHKGSLLRLGSWNDASALSSVSEKLMVTVGEWELSNLTIVELFSQTAEVYDNRLVYVIKLTRKPLLYVINLIIPLIYFLILDLASFFIRGEKLSFKVTVLLSISVLLLILQEMFPSTEKKLSLITNLCVVVFSLVGMSILETMLVEFLRGLDDYCGEKDLQEGTSHSESQASGPEVRDRVRPVSRPRQQDLLKLILEEVKAAHQEKERHSKDKSKPARYGRLAEIIDSVYFSLYFVAVVIYLVCMYLLWANSF